MFRHLSYCGDGARYARGAVGAVLHGRRASFMILEPSRVSQWRMAEKSLQQLQRGLGPVIPSGETFNLRLSPSGEILEILLRYLAVFFHFLFTRQSRCEGENTGLGSLRPLRPI